VLPPVVGDRSTTRARYASFRARIKDGGPAGLYFHISVSPREFKCVVCSLQDQTLDNYLSTRNTREYLNCCVEVGLMAKRGLQLLAAASRGQS
jgi:hypothetical protein